MGKKISIGLLIIALVSLSGYLGYRLYMLSEAHTALAEALEKTSHRADLLQRKYAEQKAQSAALQRAKLMVEGLKRQAEMTAEALAGQLAAQKDEMADIEKKIGGKVKLLEEKIAERNDVIAQWKEAHAKLTDKVKEAMKTIRQRDATIADQETQISELQSELEFASRTRDRYFSENREMAGIAKSILARYDEKGIFATSLLHVEPFTQIKKVELEQLIQGYLDKIDDHVIRDRE